ncbi:leucine-rich repeat-containing G-protein coupled receptor 5 [Plakobranchus ocellatus]|uniref:Leucine-rich repeat-containing G-protein coupled receptor 5 n=1 Tax=Plakobranchus ocellatus TaxID=259542 RepID=A0AAV4C3N0_9GAST|nr:leucine-rich repeat-containing G-protein coupled receptor 5 [Plakobranchus ocellatus]
MSSPAMKMIRLMLPLALASTFVAHLVCSKAAALKTGFVYCPAYPCQCESDDGALVINCRHLFLSSLPKFLSYSGRIKELSLRHNSIRRLPANSFPDLNIQSLDILHNVVSHVHPDAFVGMESSLKSLSLQMYAYTGFPVDALSKLKALTLLVIQGCRVPTLHRNHFRNLTSLEELHLLGFLLGSMSNKTSLESLDLSWNSISTIKECAMYNVKSLKQFALHNNPLSCTCINSWLFLWRHSERGLDTDPWRCKSPKRLKNRSFTDLSLSDFGCQNVSNTENPECTNRQARGTYFSSVVPGLFRIRLNINIDIVQNCSFKIRWSVDENKDEISNFRMVLKHRICKHRKHSLPERSDSVIISFPGSVVEHVFSQEDIISSELVCVQALNKSSVVISDVCKELITCVTNCLCDTGVGITELASDDFRKEQLEEALRNTFIPILLIYITCTLALIITIAVALVYLFNSKWRSNKLPSSCDQRRSDCFDHRTSMSSSLPISNADFPPSEVSQVLNHTDHDNIGHSNSANPQTSEMVPDRHYGLNGQYVSYNMTRDLPKIETSRNFLRPALVEVIAGQRSRFDSVSQTDFEPNRFTQSQIEEDEFYFFF